MDPSRTRRRTRALLLAAVAAVGASPGPGAAPAQEPEPAPPPAAIAAAPAEMAKPRGRAIYDALRAARPDGRTVMVAGLELQRNAFTFRFDGTFHLLRPVEGATFGAVFTGKGWFRLQPPSDAEKQHLTRTAGAAPGSPHEDTFEEMVLLFLDGTDIDVTAAGKVETGAPAAAATAIFERFLALQQEQLHTNFQLRLLEELVNDAGWQRGVFLAFFDGARTPPALAGVDPRGCDALRMTSNWSQERAFFVVRDDGRSDFWYSSDPRRIAPGAQRVNAPAWADAEHYDLQVRIDGARLSGRATVRLVSQVPRLEALPIELLPTLRIVRVAMRRPGDGEAWIDGGFVQEDVRKDADATLLFPVALGKGEVAEIQITYGGDQVLQPMGDDVFAVGARTSWYPNLGAFRDLATYRITFDVPVGLGVVAIGREVETREQDQRHLQVWEATAPTRVAGFNYGDFDALVDRDAATSTEVAVYTTKGRPEVMDYLEAALRSGDRLGNDASESGAAITPAEEAVQALGRQGLVGAVDSSQLARSAQIDAMNAGRINTNYFGPLPYDRVAITQQSQWSFGQSWPGLIFMPYLAFMASLHRMQIGELMPRGFVSDAQIEQLGYHEYAHQWWGHLVGWESYRDVWLSEGFAEFSSGLVAEHVEGRDAADAFWEEARKRIVETPRGAKIANYKAGPVSMGYRLSTRDNSSAPGAIVYSKGAYLLHMLRMMMWENKSQPPDQRFAAMMRDFAQSFAGKSPSNADFEAVVARHVTPQMDAKGDGSIGWFFEQWLHGTEIPSFRNHLTVERAGEDYRIAGTIEQLGVSEGFATFMPIYLDFGKDGMARLGAVRLIGSGAQEVDVTVKLPAKPKRVVLNAHHDVLALDVK